MRDVVVIGGGAAGLAAALTASQQGANVTVLEAKDKIGSKILATGNGRCNLTNMGAGPADYNSPAFVTPTLKTHDAKRVRHFFNQLGLITVEEREGRVYPLSNTASSVLDVLRNACQRQGVKVVTEFKAVSVHPQGKRFGITSDRGITGTADAVVVATGGGTELLRDCGHSLVPFEPVLCSLSTNVTPIRGLSGVRVQAGVTLWDAAYADAPYFSEEGEVLFRDYGVSGIVVFNASRHIEPGCAMQLDFMPSMGEGELSEMLRRRLRQFGDVSGVDLLCGVFHPRVSAAVLRAAGLKPSLPLEAKDADRLARSIKAFKLSVKGVGDARHAQVTRGGALVDEFDPMTMESRKARGLYAAGEVLNVDGRCGGYNLQWAWASGMVAGENAAL